MNSITLTLGACLLLVSLVSASLDDHWNQYKSQHGKSYSSRVEETMRRAIFMRNKQFVDTFNAEQAGEVGYLLGLNHMSDWTDAERKQLNGLRLPNQRMLRNTYDSHKFVEDLLADDSPVPAEVDWRKTPGRVTPVKDQGQCGSCWAFSTTGLLEGQEVVRNVTKKAAIGLSEQDLIDCSNSNQGCKGGFMLAALEDIYTLHGIDDDKSYPYEAVDSVCRYKPSLSVITDKDGAIMPQGDEITLMKIVAKYGPVAVGIDASTDTFLHYEGGVYYDSECSAEKLDHGVLVVGYGTDKEQGDYWIVKNSWSEMWGDNGYILMSRNKQNNCGIATVPVIATF